MSENETWNEAILRIVRAKAGVISLPEIYQEMEQHPLVTPRHRELWDNGQPRYQCAIRRRLTTLCRRSEVRNVNVGRGLYTSN